MENMYTDDTSKGLRWLWTQENPLLIEKIPDDEAW